MADLLPMWLRDAVADRRKRAQDCERAAAELTRDTTYRRAILIMGATHRKAAAVYAEELAHCGPEDEHA